MNSKKKVVVTAMALIGLLGSASTLQAKSLPVDSTGCLHVVTDVIAHTPQRVVGNLTVSATMRSNIPNSPFDNIAYRCAAYFSVLDGKYYEEGYCEGVAASGDRWLVFVSGDATRGTWKYVSGTGVFEAVEGGGEYVPTVRFPEAKAGVAQLCHRITGTWGK